MSIDKINYQGDSKVIKRIVNAINSIIDGGTGGSTVTYTQTLYSGTKTGEIEIDGVPTDMFAPTPPTKVSDLTNDSGFVTSTVNNLTNYYLKTQTYTQAEVDALISAIVTLNIVVVQTLPTQNISQTTIYLVPKPEAQTDNVYDEYINTDGTSQGWEKVGDTEIDLSDYVTTSDLSTTLADYVESSDLASVATSGSYNDLSDTPTIPSALADLTDDSTHRVVTDTEKTAWNDKLDDNPTFTEASTRANIASGESLATILGKIKKFFSDLKTVAFSGSYNDLDDKPTIPAAQVNSDWNASSGVSQILNKPSLATVATSGSYNDLSNTPTIPTKVSDLTNDSGFITGVDVEDIGDVDLTNLANGQILKYNSTSQKWENANESGGGSTYTAGDGIDISAQDIISVDTTFTEAGSRTNIDSGDTFATILGKIKKWFTDLPSMFVSKTGDTMSGNLVISGASERYVQVKNTTTNVPIALDSANDGVHGVWSSGYWSGSAYTASGKWIVYRNTTGDIILNGNAATTTKLATARNIALGSDFYGNANFDGSGNITINAGNYYCDASSGNKSNYPYHRIAYVTGKTTQWVDCESILFIRKTHDGGQVGAVKISLRTNATGGACSVSAIWLFRYGFAENDIVIAQWGATGDSVYADVFLKCGAYARTKVHQLFGNRSFTLIDSNEVSDTTSTDKKTSVEVYVDVATAATQIHGKAYTRSVDGVDGTAVNYAKTSGTSSACSGNASTATTASSLSGFENNNTSGKNANNVTYNAHTYYSSNGPATSLGASTTDGALYCQAYNSSWVAQIAQDYRNGRLFVRGKNNGSWQSWKRIMQYDEGLLLTGGTVSGPLIVAATGAVGNYDEGIRINKGKSDFCTLVFGGGSTSTTGTGDGVFWIGVNPTSYARRLMISHNGSTNTGTYFHASSSSQVSPYLRLGSSGSIANGDANAVNGGTVYSALTWNSVRDKPSTFTPSSHSHNQIVGANGNGVMICGDPASKCELQLQSDKNLVYRIGSTVIWNTGTSSRRFKHNIFDITEERAKRILDIRVVTFDYNEDQPHNTRLIDKVGVIAEEVADILDDVVVYEPNEDETDLIPRSVNYDEFTPYLIRMCQIQQRQIEDLTSKVNALEQMILSLTK